PGLNAFQFAAYSGIHLNFLPSILAALGVEGILERPTSRARAAVPAIAAVLILSTLWQAADAKGALRHPGSEFWISHWRWSAAFAVLIAIAAFALSLSLRSVSLRKGIVVALAFVVTVEGLVYAMYPRQYRWDVWRHPVAYVRHLIRESTGGRVFAAGALNANASSAFEIFGLDSLMTVNSPRVFEFYKKYFAPSTPLFLREARQLPPEPVLDSANIEQVASQHAVQSVIREAIQRGYTSTFDDGYVQVFRRKPPPRYYFTSDYRVVSPQHALEAVGESASEREIVLERSPGFPSVPNLPTDPPVLVSRFERNRYTLLIDAPRAGMLYCSVSRFPGWRGRVNGRPAGIVPANYGFSAVEVPAGRSTVEFRYWPPGLTLGLAISFSLLVATVLVGRRRSSPAATL
ncbi:MAG: YfhO family protein, partial [Vicinamibacteria bacterium]